MIEFLDFEKLHQGIKDDENIHFAIESNDEYAGTVRLKNISAIDGTAEYVIVVRKKFWGAGIVAEAT